MSGILLCISDIELLGCVKEWLRQDGHDTIEFDSVEEAVSRTFRRMPRLAIVDLWQFDAAGFITARRISVRFGIPVIVIADSWSGEDVRRAADAAISAMLMKPLREEDFLSAVILSLAAARKTETLKTVVQTLKESIERKKVVEQAKGRLMERDGLTEAEAFRKIQKLAMDRGKSMLRIAESILLTDMLRLHDRKADGESRGGPKGRNYDRTAQNTG